MATNRRTLLKQLGLGIAGIGLSTQEAFASDQELFGDFQADPIPGLRLSSNENPYGPSPLARQAFAKYSNASNRYSWTLGPALIAAIAKKTAVAPENVLLGAGSTEILDLVCKLAAAEKGNFIVGFPSYPYWSITAETAGLKKLTVPLTADKKLDLPAMQKAITSETRLIYVCNPNNPSGTVHKRNDLEQFVLEASKTAIVLIDEAYIDFTTEKSMVDLAAKNDNIIVARTFSKIYGLAGARVGFGVATKKRIEQLSVIQSWPNGSTSVASTAAALASLNDLKFVQDSYRLISEARAYTIKELEKIGMIVIPSTTSFIYFSIMNFKKDYFKILETNKIEGTGLYEEEGKWTRITVGTMKEMQGFIKALQA